MIDARTKIILQKIFTSSEVRALLDNIAGLEETVKLEERKRCGAYFYRGISLNDPSSRSFMYFTVKNDLSGNYLDFINEFEWRDLLDKN
jgi:hypothetical protein